MNSFKDVNGKIMCIGGPQELKTVEILCENDSYCFLCFFDSYELKKKNYKKLKIHLTLPTKALR